MTKKPKLVIKLVQAMLLMFALTAFVNVVLIKFLDGVLNDTRVNLINY